MNVKMKIMMKDTSFFLSLDRDGVTMLSKVKIWYKEGRNTWIFVSDFDVILVLHQGPSQ